MMKRLPLSDRFLAVATRKLESINVFLIRNHQVRRPSSPPPPNFLTRRMRSRDRVPRHQRWRRDNTTASTLEQDISQWTWVSTVSLAALPFHLGSLGSPGSHRVSEQLSTS